MTKSDYKINIIIPIVIALLIVGSLLFWIQKQRNEIAELKAKNSSLVGQKELSDGIVRSMSSYASENDIKRIIKESDLDFAVLKEDLKRLNSEITGVQRIVANSSGFKGSDIKSTKTIPGKDNDGSNIKPPVVKCPDGEEVSCPDEFGYLTNRQELALKEPFSEGSAPFGRVGFSAWKESPWDLEIYPREYRVTTVVSKDKNGKSNYHNKITISSNNKESTIPISSSNFVEKYPESKFMFNPRLYMGLDTGIMAARINGNHPDSLGDVVPNLQVSMFSYGKTKLDTEWAFLGLGVGYESLNQSASFMISPVNYNIGKPLPLVENVFLGPSLSIDVKGQVGVLMGLRVGL